MTLYEINEEITNCIDTETGEVDAEKLEALEMLRDEKIEGIALWIKDLKAEAEALKAEKQAFEKRQQAAENKAESLKNYLTGFLNGEKFKTTKCAVTFRKTQSVNIINVMDVPPMYVNVEIKPDKNAIKAALKDGKKVSGAELVESTSCQIK